VAKRVFRPAAALAILLLIPLARPLFAPAPPRSWPRAFIPDLNRHSPARLRLVPGIGPSRAHAIVAERERNGPYFSHEEVGDRVPGIGPALVRRLKEFTTVSR